MMDVPAEWITEMAPGRAINIGANDQNFQVRDVADRVQALLPDAKITYTGQVGHDPRNYRVRFDLLNRLLPDFSLQYSLESGLAELHQKLIEAGFSKDDFEGAKYVRLRTLKDRLDLLGT
jgi:nucleoside-diphosphate-sugar epimerase